MDVIIIASHRRSGTHLTIDSIKNNTQEVKDFHVLEQISSNHHNSMNLFKFKRKIKDKNKISLVKTHMMGNQKTKFNFNDTPMSFKGKNSNFVNDILSKAKLIYVYRDGRDVMVSLYHYINKIKGGSYSSDFLTHLKKYLPYWVKHIESWKDKSQILKVSFEEFALDYQKTLKKIFDFIALETNKEIKNVFQNFNKRENNILLYSLYNKILSVIPFLKNKGISAVLPRKGIVGDWKDYFGVKEKIF